MQENKAKTGLVLEGGAMRGLFTAGVTDVMMEQGIRFDGLVGVSAGAAFGCNYKSEQVGRALRYNVKYCRDPRYCSVRSWLRTGDLFGADFCYKEIPDRLDPFDNEAFERNPMEFHVVCTDVETGGAVYHRCDKTGRETLGWIRASASMPLVSRIVEVDGLRLLDGGIADPIPLKYFERLGYRRNVVILTRPPEYVKKKTGALPLLRLSLRRYPNVVSAMERRHTVYNDAVQYVRRAGQEGRAFVIQPQEALPVSRIEHDPEALRRTYELGRQTAESRLQELKAFLE